MHEREVMIMGIVIETVKTETFLMNYFRFGQGEETFVILPGLSVQSVMGFAQSVADAYQLLADNYTVYVFDRRNELPGSYNVFDMADDTAEVFKTLGLENINLFGASQGGMIAMIIAIKYPELVRKLVLGSTACCIEEGRHQKVEKWVDYAKSGDKEALYLAFGEAIYPEGVYQQSRELLIEAAKTVTDEDLKRFIVLAQGMENYDVSGDLEKIKCPVLVLGSRDDNVLGGEASLQIVERLKTEKSLHMYEGYGHAAYDMAPDYKQRILDFLKGSCR